MRRGLAGLVAAGCLLASAGCGGNADQGDARQVDREWVDNTAGVIDQLQRDLVLGSATGDSLAAARRALRSGLYTLLVADTDFGGCRHRLARGGHREAARGQRDLRSLETVGVTGPVEALVVVPHDRQALARQEGHVAQHLETEERMLLHHPALLRRQRPRLLEDAV